MKKFGKEQLLLYVVELLILIAAIALAVRWLPDLGKKSDIGKNQTTLESDINESEGESPGESVNSKENLPGEETQTGPSEAAEAETGRSDRMSKGFTKGGGEQAEETEAASEPTEAAYVPPTMIIASDLHYMSPTMTDFGEAFELLTEGDDGKVGPYLDQITDAFLEEVMAEKPSVLILSGDLSQNGEKVNHGELARKLRRVQAAGVPVVVIPGNHDINHPWAATYYGSDVAPTEQVDADGFYDIYHEFGYDGAAERDENSLSYLYKLDERYWLMMLDSCIYDPENETGGRIKASTLDWMEKWLEEAKKEQVTVIPVAHHNLLNESVLYPEECTLKNNRQVISLLERYQLPIYISGHLHLQRVKKSISHPSAEESYGIYEIVSNSVSIPPCQYGVINWAEDGSLNYQTKTIDVASWAKRQGSEDENLLNFPEYSRKFLVDVISSQVYRSVFSIPDDRKQDMADLYGELNSAYCGGLKVNRADIKKTETYFYFSRYLGDTKWFDKLSAILKDTGNDHNSLSLKAGKDFPAVIREADKTD